MPGTAYRSLWSILFGVALLATHGKAQSPTFPTSGPRDWSHDRLVAARFGPDLDQNIERDWRTHLQHFRLDQARARHNPPALDLLGPIRPVQPKPFQTASTHLDWNLKTGGFGNVVGAPAKYSFDISAANCSDVIYFTVDQAGTATRPNVIAITNAYAGCTGNAGGTTPTVKWAIQMASGTATSSVPSLDGTVLYVLESAATGVVLHAINVNNITTTTGTYDFVAQTWSNVHVLAAPTGLASSEQLFQITFTGVVNNVSSPYLDYSNNQIFFGDNAGKIYHVTNTNLTTAARDTTNFTNACGTAQLQSPVFYNNQVIVTSYNGILYRLNTAGTSPYACTAAAQLGGGTAVGISGALSPPVVDVTNSTILVVSNHDAAFAVAGIAVYPLMFTAGQSYSAGQQSGAATTTAPVYPAFDNTFWSTNSGNVYVVGAPTAGATNTYLVRFPYNGTVSAAAGFAQLHTSGTSTAVSTSPVTEFLTGAATNQDTFWVGGGGGSYLFMNRIGAGFAGTSTTPVSMSNWFAVTGGIVSQIVVDNRTSSVTGGTATSNIYFGTMGVGTTTQSTIVQLAQQF